LNREGGIRRRGAETKRNKRYSKGTTSQFTGDRSADAREKEKKRASNHSVAEKMFLGQRTGQGSEGGGVRAPGRDGYVGEEVCEWRAGEKKKADIEASRMVNRRIAKKEVGRTEVRKKRIGLP